MERGIFKLIFSILFICSLMLLHCDMPSDPTDPAKTRISAVFKNAQSEVFGNSIIDTVGKPLSIGAALYLPKNFDSISLIIQENGVKTADTTFTTFKDEYFYDTVWYSRTFSTEGPKNVTLTPYSNPILQPLSINIPIVARSVGVQVSISFISNATSATGAMPVQTYASGNSIELPENVFVNPGYRFSGWATTATGSVTYRDKEVITTDTTDLVLYAVWVDQDSIAPSVIYAPSQLIAGKADTLLFAVDNSSRTDTLTISLITDPPLDPTVFNIVPTGSDSIMIAVSQSADPTTATIGIITSNGTKSDTSSYTITLINPDEALWNVASLNLDAFEGSQYKLDLSQYLSSANGTGVSLSADIGTIDNNSWNYTPQWGCAANIQATITAKKGDLSHTLALNLTVAAGDTTKPQLSLVDASLDGKKVSSAQVNVECKATDAGAGVESVVFTCGEQQVPGTLQGEDIYSGVITGLVHNTPMQITITATDKSRQKNSATLSFSVTRDSTMLDVEPPVIVKTAGPESGARVNYAEGSLTFTVSDNSGVDSVWWTLNDAFVATVSSSGENKYMITYTLSSYGNNGIKLYAKDKSSAGNEGSQTIILNYNTEPSAITLTTPDANATDVSASPTFKWSGGDDEDGDEITFTVNYGTSQTSLSSTATVSGKTATPSSALEYAKTYYWQVTAKSSSADYPDEVKSSVGTFTTEGSLPEISAHPQSKSVEEGLDVIFYVTASGFGTLSYQWRQNGVNITSSANGPSYTLSSVTTSMNNNTYDCVVTNEVGSVTSTAATLTVTAIPFHTVKFWTEDGTPKPNDTLVRHETVVQRPLTDPQRDGYVFTDWYIENASSAFDFIGTPIDDDLQLVAGWKEVYTVTYHADDADIGTVPKDSNEYESGDWITVANNTGNLYKDGNNYKFIGWTTSQDGSGTVYTNPQMIQVSSANIDLYVKWEMNAPSFTTTITNRSCPVNDAVTFNVIATGAELRYEWQLNGGIISGATGSSYTTSNLTKDEVLTSRTYKCIVSNSAGSDNCSATLSVSTVTDASNNIYHEIKLVNKIWMMENLKTAKYNDGSLIPYLNQGETWLYETIGHYCWREDDIADKDYGALYNWPAVQNGKLPPKGWRLPTEAEWTALFEAYDLCELRTEDPGEGGYDWDGCSSYPSANFCGFNSMALGYIDGAGLIHSLNGGAFWWISEEKQAYCLFGSMNTKTYGIINHGTVGCGVRCVKE